MVFASIPVIAGSDDGNAGVQRLLVLVPDLDIDEADLVQRVWALAEPRRLPVLYLSATADDDHASVVRRRLATLATITRTDWPHVETCHSVTRNWPEAIRAVWRPGDRIVFIPQGISPATVAVLPTPAYLPAYPLSDMKVSRPSQRRQRLARLAFWPVALTTIAAFFWIQVLIEQTAQGLARTFLLLLSFGVELGLLLLWNSLLS
jgi:hypothetical protein